MIEQKIKDIEEILVTGDEFELILQDITEYYNNVTLAIKYVVTDGDGREYVYGKEGVGRACNTSNHILSNNYQVNVSLWQRENVISINQCEELFSMFWKKDNCDEVSGLISIDRENTLNKVNNTIYKWRQEKRKIAFMMIDLDNFKQVNSTYDHETGSAVISEFSLLLHQTLGKRGILIHQSGDEFNVLFSYEESNDILILAYDFKKEIGQHKFEQAADINLTMAMGIYLLESENLDYMGARNKAEEAYDGKRKNIGKQRDSVRINKMNNDSNFGEHCMKLALTRVISNRGKGVFHNIYLDFLSEYISTNKLEGTLQDEIEEILKWINPEWNTNIRCTKACRQWDTKASFSGIEVGLAVLHGILRNPNACGKSVRCITKKAQNQHACIIIEIDGKELFNKEGEESVIDEIEWRSEIICSKGFEKCIKKVVLLYAGYDAKITIPEDIFYNVVRVDTRPSTGGALPDLWAAALCELITNMNENPNLTDIIISGMVEHTKKVKKYLDNIKSWQTKSGAYSIKYISKKTFMSESDILDFKHRFEDHIYYISEASKITEKLYDIYSQGFGIIEKELPSEEENRRFLQRELRNNIELDIIHGCKAQSIADAFPVVLEILRSAATRNNECIIDQAGRKLFELIDFRILLENPRSENLPEYYKDDVDELEEYYNKTLGDSTGLFKQEFLKNRQLETMQKHIKDAIEDPEKRYATRRAILVVPNGDPTEGRYPLGLISVWLAPRFINEKVVIDFSYTWRTVEALVGLPESMYASVKFAEELTNTIREQCENTINIEMGKISYIAHSLHMFLDKESMNIIRGIINDASI